MVRLKVDGMSCGHCAAAVTRAVKDLDPGAEVRVDLEAGLVEAKTRADPDAVAKAVTAQGYGVTPA